MNISVIICTYNRAESLRQTLDTCSALQIPTGVMWELLVVDNNSTDHTKDVCQEFTGKLPLRYVFEPQQGKSNALNRSIEEAAGELLAFTDDDVDVTPSWLRALWEAVSRQPAATFFGGKVLPHWEITPPRWVIENFTRFPYQVHVDRGEAEAWISDLMQDDWPFFVGANFACHRRVLIGRFQFPSDLGPRGGDHTWDGNVRGEETILQQDLLKANNKGLYVPSAVVYHRHPARRQTERYLRHYYMGWGAMEIRGAPPIQNTHVWFGVPRYLWRQLVKNSLRYGCVRWTCPSAIWLQAEIKMATTLGMIKELRRQAQASQKSVISSQ